MNTAQTPQSVTREQVVAACAALGMDAKDLVEVRITPTRVHVTTIVKVDDAMLTAPDGSPLKADATFTVEESK